MSGVRSYNSYKFQFSKFQFSVRIQLTLHTGKLTACTDSVDAFPEKVDFVRKKLA